MGVVKHKRASSTEQYMSDLIEGAPLRSTSSLNATSFDKALSVDSATRREHVTCDSSRSYNKRAYSSDWIDSTAILPINEVLAIHGVELMHAVVYCPAASCVPSALLDGRLHGSC